MDRVMSEDTVLKEATRDIFEKTLAAIDVERVMLDHLELQGDRLRVGDELIDFSLYRRLIVIAIGKAAAPMARAAELRLADRIDGGLVVSNALTGPARLPVMLGGHPLPNETSLLAANRALALLREFDSPETLVLFLISGGGSAIFEAPVAPSITLDDLREVNRALVECGAVIAEMNVVRRRLSAVKGGRLAEAAPLSRQISLIISDVNSDDLATVASGPTLADSSKPEEFRAIIERYKLLDSFPPEVAGLIRSESLPPMPRIESNGRSTHHLLMDNRLALLEAERIARADHGLHVVIAEDLVEAEVEALAVEHLERLRRIAGEHPSRGVCLLSGGEAICPVRGPGRGGRNQEFVLRAALHLEAERSLQIVVLSAGTDGIDGKSPAAGAVADQSTIRRARDLGLDPQDFLARSDSFSFFDALGDAIITGPTGNNVRDLRVIVSR